MICVYDVETTGMPHWGQEHTAPGQPRMAQLGVILADLQWNEIASLRLLVKPEGWMMPDEAVAIHGITHERLERYGIPIKAVLVPFIEMVKRARYLVSYSSNFDAWFVKAEIRHLGSDDPGIDRPGLRVIDAMKVGALAMDNKWPKLKALHKELLKWDYPNAHDGLHDARATLRCTRVLVERKLIEL